MTPSTNPPAGIQDRAAERAKQLLADRLKRGGISTTRPDWYFQCEAGETQAYPGGFQVRVRTWRHWSDASVHIDAETGGVMHRCVDRLSDPPTDRELTEAQALVIAKKLMTVPPEAVVHSFRHEEFAERRKVARLDWIHVHDGLRVDGDYFWMMIHPETHRLVAFGKKWRIVRTP